MTRQAKARAGGVITAMVGKGYSSQQCRALVLGLVDGSRHKLQGAWRVFVPAEAPDQFLDRVAWRNVLGLLTEGLGVEGHAVDRLFQMFDVDGSGELDFEELCQVTAVTAVTEVTPVRAATSVTSGEAATSPPP